MTEPEARPSPSLAKKIVFAAVLAILLAALLEAAAGKLMPESMDVARKILMGDEETYQIGLQNTIGHATQAYVNAPNYAHPENGPQHNADGYRGKAVTLEKPEGTLRILCLGGSTTYGTGVDRPEQAYPAVLEELLDADLPEGYADMEVMNGGLPWGTTAEALLHYHFRYRYYHPDVVVLNVGGNDAQGVAMPHYHPDASHWRRPMANLHALPKGWRWLARSRVLSLFVMEIFYRDFLEGGQFVIRSGEIPKAAWYRSGGRLAEHKKEIPLKELSYYQNLRALIEMVLDDGGRLLLVPFRAAPGDGYRGKSFELGQVIRNEGILKDLAAEYGLGYAPFPADVVGEDTWTDHCHLNAQGVRQKAAHLHDYLLPLLATP
jgi:lysophospholipase L1-like esterase